MTPVGNDAKLKPMQSILGLLGEADLDALIALPPPPPGTRRLYAIAFDLDTEALAANYPNDSWRNGYKDVRRILNEEGFTWKQGSVMFGDPQKVDAVKCVLAAQRLARELPWFAEAVRDMRMLRIEENNDLMPAVEAV